MPHASNEEVTRLVFTGPSLPHEAVPVLPSDTRLLPPVKRGDVNQAIQAFPNLKSIGIVDGQFFQSFSISPKEILRWLDQGTVFFGSSSIGALRATELSVYGMVGIGKIFQMFSSGEIDADDEVAMTYDPATLQASSDPLINIRIALSRSCDNGTLLHTTMESAIRALKNLYYPDRNYRALLACTRAQLSPEEFSQLKDACQSPPNAKYEDAWQLLTAMGIVDRHNKAHA